MVQRTPSTPGGRQVLWYLALCLSGLPAAPGIATAQPYPAKLVRIVVPLAPGGGSDLLARSLAQRLTESMKQSVIVENRPGAGNTIGTEFVARAAPDGYTLLINTNAITTMPSLYPIRFNVERDLAPITMAASTQNLLAAHPSLPVPNVKQLIALAKAKPGVLTMAAAGVGTPSILPEKCSSRWRASTSSPCNTREPAHRSPI